MNLLNKLAKLGEDIITTPFSVAKDVVTMGGALTDEESSTVKKLKKIVEDLDELAE